ncbi:hypothetical protein PMAYCL1PPCAC_06009 [Pristionchus mayeri]|uniref:Uncharacterized protein n=1 Tax=Pristionchus mayeri TaxID=1317129 RepID=A0AAN4Z9G9_9BILA|nr:hypothetical protein PMAYCL1PPCAC_06009 [Pristionchus mayeri]
MRVSIIRLASSIDALPWDSFIQSVPSTVSESAKKVIEEERPFALAPHAYVDFSHKDRKSSIIWPGKEFPAVQLSFANGSSYYRQLKPLQYALSQALSLNIGHVVLHTQNDIAYKVATRKYNAKQELEIFKVLWRAMEAADAPVKARLVLEKGDDHSMVPKDPRLMTEREFAEEWATSIDRLRVL